jgi:hypothetical protein
MAGDEYILSFLPACRQAGSPISFGFGRRITPSNSINKELLYL